MMVCKAPKGALQKIQQDIRLNKDPIWHTKNGEEVKLLDND